MASGFNKFLESGGGGAEGLQDGTQPVFSSTLSAANLEPSRALRTDPSRIIQSSDLPISDITGLQATLDSKLANPMTANLDGGQFDIFNIINLDFNENKVGHTPASGLLALYAKTDSQLYIQDELGTETNITGSGGVNSSAIPSVDNRLAVYDGVGGETIRESTAILESAGALSDVVSLTTNNNIIIDTIDTNNITKYGYLAGSSATGAGLTAVGESAGTNATGIRNTAIGFRALMTEIAGTQNTAVGYDCMSGQNGGIGNTCMGYTSGSNLSTGIQNTAYGALSLSNHNIGSNTTAVGYAACSNHQGSSNVAVGGNALNAAGTGGNNVAVGRQAMAASGSGANNTAVGFQALNAITTGSDNICLGYQSGFNLAMGDSDNIIIGHGGVATDSGQIRLGTSGTHTSCLIPMPVADLTGLESSGFIDFDPCDRFHVNSTIDASNAVSIVANSGTSSGLSLINITGTATNAINLNTTAGGITLNSSSGTNITGGFTIASDIGVACSSAPVVDRTVAIFDGTTGGLIEETGVSIDVSNNMSGVGTLSATGITSSGIIDMNPISFLDMRSTANTAIAIVISADGGTGTKSTITNITGTAADSLLLNSTAGGIQLDSSSGTNVASGGLTVAGDPVCFTTSAPVVQNSILKYSDTVGAAVEESGVLINSNFDISGLNDITFGGDLIGTIPLSLGYVSGFLQVNTSTTVMTYGTTSIDSACRSSDNTFDLEWNGTKTITTSTVGVGGISDTYDPVSSAQAYEVYAVGDTGGTATNILAVESGTAITAAIEISGGTYDVYRKIGWFITQDASTTIIPHMCAGEARIRQFHYTGDRTDQTILFAGSATSWTDVSAGGNGSDHYTAPGSTHFISRIAFGDTTSANDELAFRENGSTTTAAAALYTFSTGASLAAGELADTQILVHLNTSDRITEYEVSAAANEAYMYVVSFGFGL